MRTYTRKKMQVPEIEDMESLCRLCLGKTEQMTSIFNSNAEDAYTSIPMKIGVCLGMEVSRDDALPKFMCQLCTSELNKFYTFKKNCAATYRKVKAALFPANMTVEKRGDDKCNQKITNVLGSDNGEKSSENVFIDSSQNLRQDKMLIKLPRNKSAVEEGDLKQENVTLDVNAKNSIIIMKPKKEKDNCYMIPVDDVATECTSQNLQTADIKLEEDFVNDNPLDEVKHIFEEVQTQEDVNEESSDKVASTKSLSAFIVTALIENGMLAKRDDTLEILDQGIKTFSMETACGSEIIMELVEEEPEVAAEVCNKSSPPKMFDVNLRSEGSARCCGTCGVRLSSRGALVRHQRVHSGEKPFPCRTCGRRFAQREVLRRHELLHSDKLPYQCAWCPKAYTQRGALVAHARSHAPPDARSLVLHRCSRCPKVFLYPSGLSRHMSVHEGRDFPCDECPRTFNDKSSLQRHRRAHQRARAR